MNKLTIAATALFLASTAAAHAGNSISFQIEGQHIRIETPPQLRLARLRDASSHRACRTSRSS